ncbi:MAG: alcohol dehydrogenase catalytic domain-containing protein [Anaerolineae bacterium]
MKAFALYAKEDMRLEEMALPPLEDSGMVVKVLACGVCGSDLRMFFTGPTPRYKLPIVLGHEFVAEITQVGPRVEGYALGDRVVVGPLVPCMRCEPCSRGQDNLCIQAELFGVHLPGGFAEYVYVPAQMVRVGGVVKLGEGTSLHGAAMVEILACCLHGLRQTSFSLNDHVLIIGDGPVGLTFLQLARLMGARRVVTAGRRPFRRKLAAELGADEALDAKQVNLKEHLRDAGFVPDLVIIAASSVEAATEALEIVRPGGDVLLFSGYPYGLTMSFDPNIVHYRELHLHGSIDCTIRDFRNAVEILPKLQMEKLITSAFPLEKTVEAFHAAREPEAVKVVIEP